MADYNPYCQYVLNITEEGDSGNRLFGDPKLCYFKEDLISKPMMDLSGLSEYVGVVGRYCELQGEKICYDNISLSPDGCLYIKPLTGKSKNIIIPSSYELQQAFSDNEFIKLLSTNAILDYSFVFNVRPTLYGVYLYFKNVFSDFASVDPVIYKIDKVTKTHSDEIKVGEIEGFIAKIKPFKGVEDNSDDKIVKVLEAFGINGSIDTSTLSNLYLNIPFHFKIDPLAKVSTKGAPT